MQEWLAEVRVMLKPSVNDPPGQSIRGGLHLLGFRQVQHVRAGKLFLVRLAAEDEAAASEAVDQMCARLLANPVIEHYSYEISPAESAAPAPAP